MIARFQNIPRADVFRFVFHIGVATLILIPPLYLDRGVLPSAFGYFFIGQFFLYLANVFFLVPRLLKRSKYLLYVGSIMLLIILFQFVLRSMVRPEIPRLQIVNEGRMIQFQPSSRGNLFAVFPFFMVLGLGTGFEIFMEWDRQKRRNEATKREQVYTELMFLKSQINPHFLFNTLNNIYSLASSKSEKTEKAILLLSDMLRYNLYDSSVEKIDIRKEIEFIENYLGLQRIRLTRNKDLKIDFIKAIDSVDHRVPPMLLMPFVENAFKHGISYKHPTFIHIHLILDYRRLQFEVENTIHIQNMPRKEHSGIGLENVKRRLELLYGEKHDLLLSNDQTFKVVLNIDLS